MQVDAQDYLRLIEGAGTLAIFDIEASGLRGDYNSILCVSIKPFGQKARSYSIEQAGNDQKVVRQVKKDLESFDCWCTYYGKGFDVPMINTRLLKWGIAPLNKRPHIDMYYSLKSNLLTARRSQGHLLSWLGTPEEKMSVSADVWNRIVGNPKKHMPEMKRRCESDCEGLEALYRRTKHLIREITR